MDAILTTYPLSRGFRDRLRTQTDAEAVSLSLGELRQRSVPQMLYYLRTLKVDRLLLPVEDENGQALLPVLELLASIIPARETVLIDADLQSRPVTRIDALRSVGKLARASAVAQVALRRARWETEKLAREDRIAPRARSGQEMLYLNANLWFGVKAGGSVGHISGVVNALLKEGYTVDFISAGGRLLVSDQARYEELRAPTEFGVPWELNYYRFHFDVGEQLRAIAAARRYDAIYQRLSIANYSGVVLSRRLGIPLILEYNGSEAWIARNWGRSLREQALAERVEEVNLKHAHLVVTISDVLRDELLSRGVPAERIVTYPNCIDPEMFNPARFSPQAVSELRRRHDIAEDAVVVTFVGTFGQWHGAEVLAQAVALLLDESSEWVRHNKVHFMFVGDGLKMPEVRKALRVHAEGPHVTLAGLVPQHEAPLYLAASDVLSSPHVANADGSRFFGSPTKLFEYMAMGKAIVASDLDQIGEVLANGVVASALPQTEDPGESDTRLAVLCQPGSPAQQAAGIRFLVDRPAWRARIGRNAASEAMARYTWRHHVAAILEGLARVSR